MKDKVISMKDGKTVFTDRIKNIQKNLENANYSVCYRISNDLVRFVGNLELKDEVFISEVLESVFSNLEDMSSRYEIPKDVKNKMNLDILEKMKLLADIYNTKNPSQVYESLKQLRYTTTQYQFNVWQNYAIIKFQRMRYRDMDKS